MISGPSEQQKQPDEGSKLPARPDAREEKASSPLDPEKTVQVDGRRVTAILAPGVTFDSNTDFYKIARPGFVGVDGIVDDVTDFRFLDRNGPVGNINHHQGSDMKSSTLQMYELIRGGDFFRFVTDDGDLEMSLVMNHGDGDTITTFCLADNFSLLDGTDVPEHIKQWVDFEDKLDTHSGFYPIDLGSNTAKVMSSILNGYMIARGRPGSTDMVNAANNFRAAVNALSDYFRGEPPKDLEPVKKGYVELASLPPYEHLKVPARVNVVTQEELFARVAMCRNVRDRDRLVSLIREPSPEEPDYGYQYVVGKLTPYGPYSMTLRKTVLDTAEKLLGGAITKKNNWKGNKMVIGSPRESGSLLSPFQVVAIEAATEQLEQQGKGKVGSKRLQTFLRDVLPKVLDDNASA